MEKSKSLSLRDILIFWIPLAATWLMMAFEGPFIAAVIARMVDPKFNLAAYGIAFSFALIIEAPIIMLMSASIALVGDSTAFFKLRRYTHLLNLIITLLMIALLTPPAFDFIAFRVLDLPADLAHLTHIATILLLPWPSAIGYRRFYQGILIRNKLTHLVGKGTFIRLCSMTLSALGAWHFLPSVSGAWVGSFALSAGVLMEAASIRYMARHVVRRLREPQSGAAPPTGPGMSYLQITQFYYPLALSSILGLSAQPMITFFVGQSRFPIESLAVLPVISSVSFIFKSLGLSYQEVGVALLGDSLTGYRKIRTFAIRLGLTLVAALSLLAFTPLSRFWFSTVSGLSNELMQFSLVPLMIVTILPGLEVMISFQRSVLVNSKKTFPITIATAIEVAVIMLTLSGMIHWFDSTGAVAACTALLIGRIAAIGFLAFPFRSVMMGFRRLAAQSIIEPGSSIDFQDRCHRQQRPQNTNRSIPVSCMPLGDDPD